MARLKKKKAMLIGVLFGRLVFLMSDSNCLTKKNFNPVTCARYTSLTAKIDQSSFSSLPLQFFYKLSIAGFGLHTGWCAGRQKGCRKIRGRLKKHGPAGGKPVAVSSLW
jgi:hypothetical protein